VAKTPKPDRAKRAAARPAPVAQTGRPLGPRALATRSRILDATAELLAERSAFDVLVVDIARRAGTSPATFYHYFQDVEEVALLLAERAADEMPALADWVHGPWRGEEGLERARRIVGAVIEHWDAHHAVLTLRNLAAERGDRRFMRTRERSHGPLLDALAEEVRAGQEEGRLSKELHPYAAAAALAAFLDRLAAHHRDLALAGVSRDDIRETSARILFQTLAGRAPEV
jgi:AcrR family transcriptional regulator